MNKTDFDNKQTIFNKRITSNNMKYLVTSKDRSQNTFVYQPIFDTLKLKRDKGTDYVLYIATLRI